MSRWVARALFVLLAGGLAVAGYRQGLAHLPLLPWPVREAAFSMVSFAGFVLVAGALFARRVRRDVDAGPVDATVTAVVPTYRDAEVLSNSVESLLRARGDIEVVVVCEPDDEAGLEAARGFAERDDVTCLVNGRPGTKAGAINDAVERTDGDYYAVFDADQRVPEDFFARLGGHLDGGDVVQARFLPEPGGVVEALAYYEYTIFNYCFRQPLYAVSSFRMATSKALAFTREAFESVGGYDEAVVTEDYDFGHRCYLAGLDVRLTYATTVTEEPAHTLRDWWGQRKRWMLGNVQVLHRLFAAWPDRAREPRTYVSLAIGVLSVGGALFLLSLVPKWAWLVATGRPLAAAAPLLAIYGVAGWARRRDGLPLGPAVLLVPLVLPLFACITLMAAIDYFVDFEGEWFAVQKGG